MRLFWCVSFHDCTFHIIVLLTIKPIQLDLAKMNGLGNGTFRRKKNRLKLRLSAGQQQGSKRCFQAIFLIGEKNSRKPTPCQRKEAFGSY
jgi:hypothetical protein